MGEAGDADQLLHGGGMGLIQHAAHEGGAEFRDAQGAGGAVDVLGLHPQGRRAGEKAHDVLVVQGDLLEGHAGQLLQQVHHGGVVVSEAVQLDQHVVHGVKVEVSGHDAALQVVRRVLDRGELANIVVLGQDHDAAGVLARGALDAYTARRQAVLLGFGHRLSGLLQVFEHVTVGGLFRQGADGAGAEHGAGAEQLLDIGVGPGLVFAGEVQVDIRHLVALEAQEDLEGDIKALLGQLRAADRAVLIRQIDAHRVALGDIEVTLPALGAAVVGRQGVDLGDAGHAGHEGGADATAAAHQVAVPQGLLHQLVGDGVQSRVPVADDGAELLFQALGDELRQLVPVHLVGGLPGHGLDVVSGLLPEGGEGLLSLGMGDVPEGLFHPVGDQVGVGDHHLEGLVPAQVAELLQHLVRGVEIQGRLLVAVLEALGVLDDGAEDGVLRVQEVHVARGAHGDAQLFAQPDHLAVHIPQGFLVVRQALPEHKGVVADGLDLQVVVEARDLLELVVALPRCDGLHELALDTGGAHDQPLAVLLQDGPGHMGTALEVV